MSKIIHYYRKTPTPHSLLLSLKEQLSTEQASSILRIDTESCFNVQLSTELNEQDTARLEWLLAETFDKGGLTLETSSLSTSDNVVVLEFGPRMTFTSAFSSNATSICAACGLDSVSRLERSRRYAITFTSSVNTTDETVTAIKALLHDRMTEEEYVTPLTSFEAGVETKEIQWVPIMEEGRAALEKINDEMGLGFDEWDLNYYTELFQVRYVVVVV